MSNPTLVNGYGWIYYQCDRDPTATESNYLTTGIGCYLNIADLRYPWFNMTTKTRFECLDNTENAMVWQKVVTDDNLSSLLPAPVTWNINGSVSLAFGAARTASATNNVDVVASFAQSSTVLNAAIVYVQLYISGSWVTIATVSLSGLLTSQTNSITFSVPKNMQYRFINQSGSNTISSIYEFVK